MQVKWQASYHNLTQLTKMNTNTFCLPYSVCDFQHLMVWFRASRLSFWNFTWHEAFSTLAQPFRRVCGFYGEVTELSG